MLRKMLLFIVCLLSLSLVNASNSQQSLTVAVASNFRPTLQKIVTRFEKLTGNKVLISSASTGKLYQQIKNGAPFDIFLAADAIHPTLLTKTKLAVAQSRFTYALGRLVLWAPKKDIHSSGAQFLKRENYRYLSIANPKFAPYGIAAQQVLKSLGVWAQLRPRIVEGENVSQAVNYVASHNAELGIVALSLVKGLSKSVNVWLIPTTLYQPIQQQAVLLTRAKNNKLASQFIHFLKTNNTKILIRDSGYTIA